jgi:hypothetical protein
MRSFPTSDSINVELWVWAPVERGLKPSETKNCKNLQRGGIKDLSDCAKFVVIRGNTQGPRNYNLSTILSQLHFGTKSKKATHTPKSEKMEFFGTPKNLEDGLTGQISSPWCVSYINEKLLKRRCPKWPHVTHLDIISPSYGQKKGQESNCQFDSRPLKVENRALSLKECNTALKSFWRELQLWFRACLNPSLERGVMTVQSLGLETQDSFETLTWESREKEPFGCSLGRELQSILYGGRWWLPSSPDRGESCV